METGVTTPETAGQGGSPAGMRLVRGADQRQLYAHFRSPHLLPL
ncbi:hypothetical protein SNL152K_4869 [Streptomyces sp. NL15-2K]|nr:hypothetical protein SNL152K_4869 [Streptomyces sp. NL15-2K]